MSFTPCAAFLLSFIRLSYHNPKRIDNLSCFCRLLLGRFGIHGFTAHIKRLPYWSFVRPRACGYLSRARHLLQSTQPLLLSRFLELAHSAFVYCVVLAAL